MNTKLHDSVKLLWPLRVRKPTHLGSFGCSVRPSMNARGDAGGDAVQDQLGVQRN